MIGYGVRVLILVLITYLFYVLVVAQVDSASTVDNQAVEDPPSMKFTWTIENFSRLNTKKHYSDTFLVGSYKW